MTNDEIKVLLSQHGGSIDALTMAFAALCETLRPDSELAGLINGRLEQAIASKLHNSENEAYLQSFEKTRAFLVEMLLVMPPPDGCK